ncbi:GerW family sporulation protein [Sporosalibacterium faouarense]|uniref:GerW family sporulation protein n=1 Tax=Sporosalibacterium faouarense TaxID=516123 RepID=UPI00192B422B|nr:GerW family sporulation protein [Sporosalibacterium faouarense]
MSDHPIEGLMQTTMESIKEMVDVNTIVGDPVESPDGLVIIPISKVSFGFASGGGEYSTSKDSSNEDGKGGKLPFGGGSGAGVSLQPVAFIVVGNGQIKLMPVDQGSNLLNNIIDTIPNLTNGLQNMMKQKKDKKIVARKFKIEKEEDDECQE